jgi:hypothetical protein
MAKLTNVRERIDDVLIFETPDERRLAPLGHQEGECDDAFVVLAVSSPPSVEPKHKELLRIAVNERVQLAWPIDDLHTRHKRIDMVDLAKLVEAYGGSVNKLLLEPGVLLSRGIVVPSRALLRVDTTNGTSITAYLRGLRSRDVQ